MKLPDEIEPTSAIEFDKLQEALENSSSRNTRLLVTFILFLLYLLVIVAATTDLQLILPESRITLPLLRVELNMFGFYLVAPALVLILHFNLLLNLMQHAKKLKAWNEKSTKPEGVLLPVFFFNYSISFKEGTMNYILLRALLAGVLCFLPICVLVFIQIRFAAYHSVSMTAVHFGLVLLDLFVILVYWHRIIYPQLLDESYDSFRKLMGFYWQEPGFAAILDEAVKQFERSIVKASWPRKFLKIYLEPFVFIIKYILPEWRNLKPCRVINPIYNPLFACILVVSFGCLAIVFLVTIDYFDYYHGFIPRLDVSGTVLVNSPPSDVIVNAYLIQGKTEDSAWVHHSEGINLRGRDLRFAKMDRTKIWNGQLQHAYLNGADFNSAILNYAHLDSAILDKADFYKAIMNFAHFNSAQLNSADFMHAELNGADLQYAKLNVVRLRYAEMNGINLKNAELKNAYLENAKLNGADLRYAKLNGAQLDDAELNYAQADSAQLNNVDLEDAELNGASLYNTEMIGTELRHAELNGADLEFADLNGADLEFAELNGAYLGHAELNGADLEFAELNGADLKFAELNGADLNYTKLNGTDLYHAQLVGADASSRREREDPIFAGPFLAGAYMEQTSLCGINGNLYSEPYSSVYFQTEIDSTFIPDWDELRKDSLLIIKLRSFYTTDRDFRRDYINRLNMAEERAESLGSEWRYFQLDSVGFITARKAFACQSTYIGQGLLSQYLRSRGPKLIQTEETLLEHMDCNCPDSLNVILARADDYLRTTIENFLSRNSPDGKQ